MKKDARKMTDRQLLKARKMVVELHRQQTPIMHIAQETGLSWPAVKAAIRRYEEGGIEALEPKRRGKKEGTGRLLTPEQEIELCEILYQKRPWQLGITCPVTNRRLHLWNREVVKTLICNKYDVLLSDRGLANYLKRWGFPTQKRHRNHMKHCCGQTKEWLDENYIDLLKRPKTDLIMQPKSECMEIYWISKRAISITQPSSNGRKRKKKLTMASLFDRSGKEHWLVFPAKFTAEMQMSFLMAVRSWSRKKPLLIRDNMKSFDETSQVLKDGDIELYPPVEPHKTRRNTLISNHDFDPEDLWDQATDTYDFDDFDIFS